MQTSWEHSDIHCIYNSCHFLHILSEWFFLYERFSLNVHPFPLPSDFIPLAHFHLFLGGILV